MAMGSQDKDFSPLNISEENDAWNKMALEISYDERLERLKRKKLRLVERSLSKLYRLFGVTLAVLIFLLLASAVHAQDGTLEVLAIDKPDGRSEYAYYLKTPTGRLELRNLKGHRQWRTGDRVRVKGKRTGDAVRVNTMTALQLAPLPAAVGPKKTIVILMNFLGNTAQPWTVTQVQQAFTTVSDFYRENSYGLVWIEGAAGSQVDVVGYFTVPDLQDSPSNPCIVDAIYQADQVDLLIDLTPYHHVVHLFPYVSYCGFSGAAYIGGTKSWINGFLIPDLFAHEIGHNYGLFHSHSLDCLGVFCNYTEYGNIFDIMGGMHGHFNAGQKEDLGWLIAKNENKLQPRKTIFPPIINVTRDGSYFVSPYESQNKEVKGLKIPTSIGTYYVEYRAGLGVDIDVPQGVIIHFVDDAILNGNYLLDIDLGPGVDWTLDQGQVFADGVVTITALAVNGTGATVHVRID